MVGKDHLLTAGHCKLLQPPQKSVRRRLSYFLTTVTKHPHKRKLKGERLYFGLPLERAVFHHGEEDTTGAGEAWWREQTLVSHCIPSQDAESHECMLELRSVPTFCMVQESCPDSYGSFNMNQHNRDHSSKPACRAPSRVIRSTWQLSVPITRGFSKTKNRCTCLILFLLTW